VRGAEEEDRGRGDGRRGGGGGWVGVEKRVERDRWEGERGGREEEG